MEFGNTSGYKRQSGGIIYSNPLNMDAKGETDYHRQLRRVAFAAVAVSTAAICAAVITLPMLYAYVQTLQSQIIAETDYCKVRSRDLWHSMNSVDRSARAKRGWLFGQWVPDGGRGGGAAGPKDYGYQAQAPNGYGAPVVNAEPEPQCCTCQQGPVGPAGPPGDEGHPGRDGNAGNNANNGADGEILPSDGLAAEPCILCPTGPQGAPGLAGSKGPNGPRGAPGHPGMDGRVGEPGMAGAAGLGGEPGPLGPKGRKGEDGRVIHLNGPPGTPGAQGPQGRKGDKGPKGTTGKVVPGPKGENGDAGRPGRSGKKGESGGPGGIGSRGNNGDCSHCPNPRLPSGY